MSVHARLSAETSINKPGESNIFLTLQNLLSDAVNIDWEIIFPFPVDTDKPRTGKERLDAHENIVKSWTTKLTQLRHDEQQEVPEKEIVVKLTVSSAGNFYVDGIRSTLKQIYSLHK